MDKRSVMSQLRKLHAMVLNIGARIFGVMAVIWGLGFSIWGLSLVLNPNATIGVNGVASSDPWEKASILVVGLVFIAIGILVLMARPYKPRE